MLVVTSIVCTFYCLVVNNFDEHIGCLCQLWSGFEREYTGEVLDGKCPGCPLETTCTQENHLSTLPYVGGNTTHSSFLILTPYMSSGFHEKPMVAAVVTG